MPEFSHFPEHDRNEKPERRSVIVAGLIAAIFASVIVTMGTMSERDVLLRLGIIVAGVLLIAGLCAFGERK